MKRSAPAAGHQTPSPDNCPECSKVDGWQKQTGLRYFAQLVRHETDDDNDRTLADVIDWVTTHHLPDDDGLCRECGERWYTPAELPNIGGMRCMAWLEMRLQRNAYVQRRLDEMKARWGM